MSSIPLPSLGVRPPQQQPYLEQMGQAMQLKSMLGQQQLQRQQLQGAQIENQMRTQQLKDSQLYGKALLNSDPSNPESMLQYFVKNGGSGQGAMQLQQMLLARRKQLSDIAASDATTGAKNLETLKGTNDLIAGQLHSLQSLPDDQLPQAFASTAQNLAKMDPNGQQHFQQLSQVQDPNQLRQGLKVLEYSYLGDSALADRELKGAQTNEANQKAEQAKQEAALAGSRNALFQQYGGTDPQDKFVHDYLAAKGLPNTPENRVVAVERYKTIAPAFTFNMQAGGPGGPKDIADAIIRGDQPPTTQGLYRNAMAVKAELARRGFNLASAELDWDATKKYMQTLNGAQQTRLRQAIQTASDSLDKIQNLYEQLQRVAPTGGFKIWNKTVLAGAKNLPGEAGSLATNLDAQLADLTSELGNVYMGGNSPTDHALGLAQKNLSGDWNRQTFEDALKQARLNLQIRKNSILNAGPAGLSGTTNYTPQGQPQSAPSTSDPMGIR